MKRYITLIAAVALVACSNEELSTPENNMATSEAPVNFEVYTQRGLTRAGTPNDLTNTNIGGVGFGVFGYYTAGEVYSPKATPNFMYNEHVTKNGTAWTYEPVKYWPNEFGSDAKSDEVDRVSFFAYAPWTEVDLTTGNVAGDKNHNIVAVNKFSATGDPLIKYVVDTNPATSVDLLWGVAAENAAFKYSAIQGTVTITEGKPFIDLVKPNNPQSDRLMFNLKHALAKVKVTIDYIDDANTPAGPAAATIYPEETRIYVRSFKISGFALKGALNLNNTIAGQPLWKEFDGVKDLAFDEIIFQDGRRDGKEGETNGAQPNETPQGLNPQIVENFCLTTNNNGITEFGATKSLGVTEETIPLFGGNVNENGGYFFVIPRNGGSGVDIEIAYDVETIDQKLVGKLSDNETHGISIENVISKEKIFGDGVDFEPGKVYEIKIHLGMTSAKVDATVSPWVEGGSIDVNLPENQGGNNGNGGNNGGNNLTANQMITSAFAYQYDPAWTYGTYSVNDDEITYTLNSFTSTQEFAAATNKMMNDLARFLGGLHHGANVQKIVYNGNEYIWDDNQNNTGSKWVKNVDQTPPTLVHDITSDVTNAYQTTPLTTKTLTITADDKDIKFTFNIPQNAVTSSNAGDEAIHDVQQFDDLKVYANQYSTTPLGTGTSGGIVTEVTNNYISLNITSGYGANAYDDYYIQPNAVYNPHIAYRYPVYTSSGDIGDPTKVVFWIEWE